MTTKYQMQGVFVGAMVSWRTLVPDWLGALYPGEGLFPTEIALSGGGFTNPAVGPGLYQVTISGVGVTAAGVELDITPFSITISGIPMTIAGAPAVMTF